MKKPKWKDAPTWANYRSQDKDGTWWWWEFSPIKGGAKFSVWVHQKGRVQEAGYKENKNWYETLEKRPQKHEVHNMV